MFKNIRQSLQRTRQSVFGHIVNVLGAGEITEETWEELEALLIQADMGVPTTLELVDNLRGRVQAHKFKESVAVTGVILTKLDSTAKGGMVFAIYRELGLPVRFIGTGEKIEDLAPFDAEQFIDGLFATEES